MTVARTFVVTTFLLLTAFAVDAAGQAPQEPRYPPSDHTFTVTAADIDSIADAVDGLAKSEDRLVANLAVQMPTLAYALLEPPKGRTAYAVGPLVADEEKAIDLRDYLAKYSVEAAPIRLELRRTWTESDPRIFTFTVPGFIQMLAAMAKGPVVQLTVEQRRQLVFIGRMTVDLNQQAGFAITERSIFAALAGGFRDTAVAGRLARVVLGMAANGGTYDLIPEECIADIADIIGAGFIVPATHAKPRRVTVRYGGNEYTTTADDLLWSLLRFFAGDDSKDWALRAQARSRSEHGRDILAHLETQIAQRAMARARPSS